MNKTILYIVLLPLALLLSACRTPNTPVAPAKYASEFTSGQLEYYGAYYEKAGLRSDVWAIDLYSDGLRLSTAGYMEGTGTNLYFSDLFLAPQDSCSTDVFVSDTALVFVSDTTGQPGTFLPGTYYEGNFTGAYLLLVEDGQLAGYTLLKEGTLTLYKRGQSYHLTFAGKTTAGKAYECLFDGTLRLRKNTTAEAAARRHYLPLH